MGQGGEVGDCQRFGGPNAQILAEWKIIRRLTAQRNVGMKRASLSERTDEKGKIDKKSTGTAVGVKPRWKNKGASILIVNGRLNEESATVER